MAAGISKKDYDRINQGMGVSDPFYTKMDELLYRQKEMERKMQRDMMYYGMQQNQAHPFAITPDQYAQALGSAGGIATATQEREGSNKKVKQPKYMNKELLLTIKRN